MISCAIRTRYFSKCYSVMMIDDDDDDDNNNNREERADFAFPAHFH